MAGFDYSAFVYRNGVYMPDVYGLGTGRVRVTIPKNYPVVTIDGVEEDMKQLFVFPHTPDEDGYVWTDADEDEYAGEFEGYRFQARHVGGNMLDVELIEPDGTIWQARGGYHFGQRFEEECGTAEDFYANHIRRASFHWTRIPPS